MNSVTRDGACVRVTRCTANAVPHAPPPSTATSAVIGKAAQRRNCKRGASHLQTEHLREPHVTGLSVAMAHLDPSRRGGRRRRRGRLGELEQNVPLGAKHDGGLVVRRRANVGPGRTHEQHPLVGERLARHPADRPRRIADLRPAFHAHQRFDGNVAPVHEERLRTCRRRVVQDGGGLARRSEIGRAANAGQQQRDGKCNRRNRPRCEEQNGLAIQFAAAGAPAAACAICCWYSASKLIGARWTGGKPAWIVALATVSRAYGNRTAGQWIASTGCNWFGGTPRMANRPACAASTRNTVLSLERAVTVIVSTHSYVSCATCSARVRRPTSICGASVIWNDCGAPGFSSDRSLT